MCAIQSTFFVFPIVPVHVLLIGCLATVAGFRSIYTYMVPFPPRCIIYPVGPRGQALSPSRGVSTMGYISRIRSCTAAFLSMFKMQLVISLCRNVPAMMSKLLIIECFTPSPNIYLNCMPYFHIGMVSIFIIYLFSRHEHLEKIQNSGQMQVSAGLTIRGILEPNTGDY